MNKIKIYGISISICAVFVSLLINSAYAQSLDNSSNAQSLDNFLTYTNDNNKFTIQYPADWEVEETDPELCCSIVKFKAPAPERSSESEENSFEIPHIDPFFIVPIRDLPKPYLDTGTMTLKNLTVEQYAQKCHLEFCLADITNDPSFTPIRSNEIAVDEKLGWKNEYILGKFYHLQVFTIENDKVYELNYAALPTDAPKALPLANKMIESFQIGGK